MSAANHSTQGACASLTNPLDADAPTEDGAEAQDDVTLTISPQRASSTIHSPPCLPDGARLLGTCLSTSGASAPTASVSLVDTPAPACAGAGPVQQAEPSVCARPVRTRSLDAVECTPAAAATHARNKQEGSAGPRATPIAVRSGVFVASAPLAEPPLGGLGGSLNMVFTGAATTASGSSNCHDTPAGGAAQSAAPDAAPAHGSRCGSLNGSLADLSGASLLSAPESIPLNTAVVTQHRPSAAGVRSLTTHPSGSTLQAVAAIVPTPRDGNARRHHNSSSRSASTTSSDSSGSGGHPSFAAAIAHLAGCSQTELAAVPVVAVDVREPSNRRRSDHAEQHSSSDETANALAWESHLVEVSEEDGGGGDDDDDAAGSLSPHSSSSCSDDCMNSLYFRVLGAKRFADSYRSDHPLYAQADRRKAPAEARGGNLGIPGSSGHQPPSRSAATSLSAGEGPVSPGSAGGDCSAASSSTSAAPLGSQNGFYVFSYDDDYATLSDAAEEASSSSGSSSSSSSVGAGNALRSARDADGSPAAPHMASSASRSERAGGDGAARVPSPAAARRVQPGATGEREIRRLSSPQTMGRRGVGGSSPGSSSSTTPTETLPSRSFASSLKSANSSVSAEKHVTFALAIDTPAARSTAEPGVTSPGHSGNPTGAVASGAAGAAAADDDDDNNNDDDDDDDEDAARAARVSAAVALVTGVGRKARGTVARGPLRGTPRQRATGALRPHAQNPSPLRLAETGQPLERFCKLRTRSRAVPAEPPCAADDDDDADDTARPYSPVRGHPATCGRTSTVIEVEELPNLMPAVRPPTTSTSASGPADSRRRAEAGCDDWTAGDCRLASADVLSADAHDQGGPLGCGDDPLGIDETSCRACPSPAARCSAASSTPTCAGAVMSVGDVLVIDHDQEREGGGGSLRTHASSSSISALPHTSSAAYLLGASDRQRAPASAPTLPLPAPRVISLSELRSVIATSGSKRVGVGAGEGSGCAVLSRSTVPAPARQSNNYMPPTSHGSDPLHSPSTRSEPGCVRRRTSLPEEEEIDNGDSDRPFPLASSTAGSRKVEGAGVQLQRHGLPVALSVELTVQREERPASSAGDASDPSLSGTPVKLFTPVPFAASLTAPPPPPLLAHADSGAVQVACVPSASVSVPPTLTDGPLVSPLSDTTEAPHGFSGSGSGPAAAGSARAEPSTLHASASGSKSTNSLGSSQVRVVPVEELMASLREGRAPQSS